MSEAQTKARTGETAADRDAVKSPELPARHKIRPRLRIIPVLITLVTVALAVSLASWTRDDTVRVYVVTMAPEVAGRIVGLPVADNQFVHKGDLLKMIDPRDYRIAVSRTEAAVQQAQANARNAEIQSQRRQKLNQLAVTIGEQQTYATTAVAVPARA
jgi:multidrug resistance efflux pump